MEAIMKDHQAADSGAFRDAAGIPFGAYAERLRNEGISSCGGMAHRAGNMFAYSDAEGTDLLSDSGFAVKYPLMHAIFTARPDCNAIIRSSPHFCAMAAREGKGIPPVLDDTAQIIGTSIRVCDAGDVKRLHKIMKRSSACLLRDDREPGVIAAGGTLEKALAATLIAEKTAQAFVEGKLIGGTRPLSLPVAFLMHKVYDMSYGRRDERTPVQSESDLPYVIPEEEMDLRRQIVECGRRMRAANLVQGTWGNISVRLDDRYMLVTPSGLDYERLTPYEIVRVDIDTLGYEGNIKPTSERSIHAALLKSDPEAKCIIHTHSVNCSVFAAAKREMAVIDEADRALLGDIVPYAKAAIPGTRKLCREVESAMKDTGKACIMGSHGIIVRGVSIEDAFGKCRAMEHAARAYLDSMETGHETGDVSLTHLKPRSGHIDVGSMCLDALRERYRLIPEDIGADAAMKAKGMKFTTESYKVDGLGHFCILRMKAFAGLMKMETAVLAVNGKDLPLLNIDWMSVAGNETQIVELYDVQLAEYPAEHLDAFAAIRDRDGDIEEYTSGDHWYDNIRYASSYSKRGKKVSDRFNAAAEAYLTTYLDQAESAEACDTAGKTDLIRNYAGQLLTQGGPAVDQVKKLFGEDYARRLIQRYMYGVGE